MNYSKDIELLRNESRGIERQMKAMLPYKNEADKIVFKRLSKDLRAIDIQVNYLQRKRAVKDNKSTNFSAR